MEYLCVSRFPLYSLFPTQGANRPTIHKVTESLFSTSLSTFGVPTPPPNSPYSPLQLEVLNCSQRLVLADKEPNKMDEAKLGKCMPELCCPGDRQVIDGLSMMQPLTIKTEQAKRSCNTCLTNSPKKVIHSDGGCSRTNPVTWLGVAGQNVQVQVKREPQQLHMSELVAVKLEQASPGNKPEHPPIPASLNNGSIPVGIAVARQRVGDAGLLAALSQKDNQQRMHDIGATSYCCHPADAAQAAMTVGVANVLCDDRPTPLAWPAPSAAPPAPLWQYPTAQVSMESMMVGGVGVGGVGSVGGGVGSVGGFQLVREPTSGALLLLPTPPDLQHAVVWGGMPYPSAPLLLPPAPHPSHHLQLLPGDLLASTATLQHTHTHSTRLVTLAPAPAPQPHPTHADKRKPIIQPLITPHALIKIEPEPPQEKPQPTFAPEPVQQPMLATHLYYQPDYSDQVCRSQATSPAAPPTPPPEAPEGPAHKDASNQTDHIDDEDESPNHADEDERDVACVGVAHFPEDSIIQTQTTLLQPAPIDSAEDSSSEGMATSAVVGAVEKAIDAIERDEAMGDSSSSGGSHDLVIDTASTSPVPQQSRPPVDVSGLELLSNSIEQFERTTPSSCMPALEPVPLTVDTRTTSKLNILIKSSPKSPPRTEAEQHARFEYPPVEPSTSETSKQSFDGLGLLCALAEQRFMEEVENPPAGCAPASRPFIKSELLSPTDIDRAKEMKREKHRHRDDDSSSERRRKRSHDRTERLRHKIEKMRRHKRERDQDEARSNGGEIEASLRRVTACACGVSDCSHVPAVPSAQALVNAIEKDMRETLEDLQRQCDEKRAQLDALTPPLLALSTPPTPSTPALSPNSDRGSSKKRKVGRPRKVSSPDSTETIVAKKPKSKSSLVGYLLAKGKLKGGILCTRGEPSREDAHRTSKVRPKLKAEPILKVCSEEEENEWGLNRSASSSMESLNEVRQKNREKVDRLVRKHSRDDLPELEFAVRRASASSDSDKERRRAKKRRKSVKSKERSDDNAKAQPAENVLQQASICTLTEDKLDSSPRVLTAMGGLFYAGKLSAVQAPDVYAITLDGERGNKPHILSREETLRDAILEVSPTSVSDLSPGARVCAYWSQQYRCLYPGTVAVASPDPRHDNFVAVEFDDGDSGRIAIEDIRFLEPNYPVVEYENPLFTLGKRRRNTSVTEDKRATAPTSNEPKPSTSEKPDEEEHHKDRKKLKKHRKDKIKRHSSEDDPSDYVKKKKKKHKCCEEHCKHRRHHKKHHRKHRKRHHSNSKEHSSSSGEDNQRQKSSSDYIDSNKSNEDSGDSNDRLSTLIACEKSPDEKMKTVIKKAVLSKKSLVKNAVLDFSNLGKMVAKKDEEAKDNLKDSGICLEEDASTSDAVKKKKRRTVSSSSDGPGASGVSKMAAFLPGAALWRWSGTAYRRAARPRLRKLFYRAIQRGDETLRVGEAAVFLSTGRADRPYIGRIVALWEARGAMAVRVKWFYHPEETNGCHQLQYPGGLFESPHTDENDVQTISHKCEVLPLAQYKERMGDDPVKYSTVYDNNDVYYLAGHYDPTQQTLKMEPDIPFANNPNS
ncbi:hypothetical protein evm_005345 [Chilo suppressalis]|nr:hypothetical protein evm_005345 [Chilo suppressalis]